MNGRAHYYFSTEFADVGLAYVFFGLLLGELEYERQTMEEYQKEFVEGMRNAFGI